MSKIMQSKQSQKTLMSSKRHVANIKRVFYKRFKQFIPLIVSLIIISCILISPYIHFYAKQVDIKKPILAPKTSASIQPLVIQGPQLSATSQSSATPNTTPSATAPVTTTITPNTTPSATAPVTTTITPVDCPEIDSSNLATYANYYNHSVETYNSYFDSTQYLWAYGQIGTVTEAVYVVNQFGASENGTITSYYNTYVSDDESQRCQPTLAAVSLIPTCLTISGSQCIDNNTI